MSIEINKDNLKQVTLREIWRNINISTTLFLKLFEDICKDTKYLLRNSHIQIPIHYLAFEYGLLSCYISKDKRLLKLVFDNSVAISDLNITNNKYYSFIDRLLDSNNYHSVDILEKKDQTKKLLVISLKIPNKYRKDIEFIAETSKFSSTSKDFKQAMRPNFTRINGKLEVPDLSNPKAKYIILNNIPYGIVFKDTTLAKMIQKELDVSKIEAEYFILWNDYKEIYNKDIIINKYL